MKTYCHSDVYLPKLERRQVSFIRIDEDASTLKRFNDRILPMEAIFKERVIASCSSGFFFLLSNLKTIERTDRFSPMNQGFAMTDTHVSSKQQDEFLNMTYCYFFTSI